MTKKQKHLMKSMLNYYEIDVEGTRSEKMSKTELESFLEKFNRNYDLQIIQDVIKKVKDNFNRNSKQSEGENLPNDIQNFEDFLSNDLNPFEEEELGMNDFPQNQSEPSEEEKKKYKEEVNQFLDWLSNLLHKTNHRVIITNNGLNTTIQLLNLQGGKKK